MSDNFFTFNKLITCSSFSNLKNYRNRLPNVRLTARSYVGLLWGLMCLGFFFIIIICFCVQFGENNYHSRTKGIICAACYLHARPRMIRIGSYNIICCEMW